MVDQVIAETKDLLKQKENETNWSKIFNLFDKLIKTSYKIDETVRILAAVQELLSRSIQSDRTRLSGISIDFIKKVSIECLGRYNFAPFLPILIKISGKPSKIYVSRALEGLVAIAPGIDIKYLEKFIALHIGNINKNVRYALLTLVKLRYMDNKELFDSYVEKGLKDQAQEIRALCREIRSCKAEEQKPAIEIKKHQILSLTPRKSLKVDRAHEEIKKLESDVIKITRETINKKPIDSKFFEKLTQIKRERQIDTKITPQDDLTPRKLDKYLERFRQTIPSKTMSPKDRFKSRAVVPESDKINRSQKTMINPIDQDEDLIQSLKDIQESNMKQSSQTDNSAQRPAIKPTVQVISNVIIDSDLSEDKVRSGDIKSNESNAEFISLDRQSVCLATTSQAVVPCDQNGLSNNLIQEDPSCNAISVTGSDNLGLEEHLVKLDQKLPVEASENVNFHQNTHTDPCKNESNLSVVDAYSFKNDAYKSNSTASGISQIEDQKANGDNVASKFLASSHSLIEYNPEYNNLLQVSKSYQDFDFTLQTEPIEFEHTNIEHEDIANESNHIRKENHENICIQNNFSKNVEGVLARSSFIQETLLFKREMDSSTLKDGSIQHQVLNADIIDRILVSDQIDHADNAKHDVVDDSIIIDQRLGCNSSHLSHISKSFANISLEHSYVGIRTAETCMTPDLVRNSVMLDSASAFNINTSLIKDRLDENFPQDIIKDVQFNLPLSDVSSESEGTCISQMNVTTSRQDAEIFDELVQTDLPIQQDQQDDISDEHNCSKDNILADENRDLTAEICVEVNSQFSKDDTNGVLQSLTLEKQFNRLSIDIPCSEVKPSKNLDLIDANDLSNVPHSQSYFDDKIFDVDNFESLILANETLCIGNEVKLLKDIELKENSILPETDSDINQLEDSIIISANNNYLHDLDETIIIDSVVCNNDIKNQAHCNETVVLENIVPEKPKDVFQSSAVSIFNRDLFKDEEEDVTQRSFSLSSRLPLP